MNINSGKLLLYRIDKKLLTLDDNSLVSNIITLAADKGWQGNLWHCFLTYLLVESENPFSLRCERRQCPEDSLKKLALCDIDVFFDAFHNDINTSAWDIISDFKTEDGEETLSSLAKSLYAAKSPAEMLDLLTAFYKTRGLGMLGMGQVFRLNEDGEMYPVLRRRPVKLDDLVGYTEQKKQLVDNTLSFLRGNHANNALLYGDAGTGKSTSIQALVEEYSEKGLRLVELYKHQYHLIPKLFNKIKDRNYRFIILLDDLSFEENEVEYKYLKAVLEGGAEASPENIRIYATSNRRHLIKETWNDRNDMEHNGDIHRSDTMEEKLSLSARFGLQIFYPNPTFDEYHKIVSSIVNREGAAKGLTSEQIKAAASTWQVRHGSRSGRTARQFVDSLSCLD